MMKKLIIFTIAIISLFSCQEDLPATLQIEVSYYYNAYQGYKPDIGAVAFLCEESKTSEFNNDSTAALFIRAGFYTNKKGDLIRIPHKYKAEAGVTGIINITDVTPGNYLLLLVSEGRFTYTHKYLTIKSGDAVSLVKNFYYTHDYDYGGETW